VELMEQIIAELRSLVERITVDQPTPAKKFIYETLFGLCASGSVLLTEVGRKLPSNISLHAVEKRLSRQLGSERWDASAMLARYVQWAAHAIKSETVLALDTSDIRKAYAEKMECLGKVHDGSTGEIATGYWLLCVEAHQASGQRQGIYLQAWSAQSEEFESENREMLRAVELVERFAPSRALWVIDSGGDRSCLHREFKRLKVRYLVRVGRNRTIELNGHKQGIRQVAAKVLLRGSFRFPHRTKRGRWRVLRLRYGFERIIWQEEAYSLVIAEGISDEQLILWTNELVSSTEEAEQIVRKYLRRWAVEDANRVIKQEFTLEAIRVSGWRRVQRLVLLVGIAYGFVCRMGGKAKRVVKKLIELSRRLRPPKKVLAYAIRKGIAALWAAGLQHRPSFGFG
jgi:Transposase DDE domain